MAILYDPKALLKKMAPLAKVKRLVTNGLTVNKAALTALSNSGVISKTSLSEIAIGVVQQYKEKKKTEIADGASVADATETALNGKALMVQRVQNAAVFKISEKLRTDYGGEAYVWLPSDANIPDPLHQLNYGKTFIIGEQEDPGERYGCRCGMNILVKEDTINL